MKNRSITGSDGVRLHVVEAGREDAQPILFIHGWSQSHLCWKTQLNSPLADQYRLVAIDLRGHGDSDKPLTGYDEAAWAGDLEAVMRDLRLQRPIIVAWSYGGLIVNDYLRRHGDTNIAGLCYVGAATDLGIETAYDFLGSSWNGLMPERPGAVSGTVFSEDAEEIATAMRRFLRGCFARPVDPDDEITMLGFNLQCPSRVRGSLLSRVVGNDDVLAQIRVPALVIHGGADEVVRPDTSRHIASKITGAHLSIYDGVGHAPFWEEAERFNADLDAFASGVLGGSERTAGAASGGRGL